MVNDNYAVVLAVITAWVAVLFVAMFLWSKAKSRGRDEGLQKNEDYYRLVVDVLERHIEAREHALAMYRDIATTLCAHTSDCMYCPYECDRQDRKCALWELNGQVSGFGIEEVHVDTKYDGDDKDGR